MAGTRKVEIIPRPPDPGPSTETKLQIVHASKVIRASHRGRLPEEVVFDILLWTAEGLNWQKIQKRAAKKHNRILAQQTIVKYQTEFAPKIREMTADWDREAIGAGLARKAVRLRKLQQIAQVVEDRIIPDDDDVTSLAKALLENPANMKALISEYRELLKQIGIEVGDISDGASGDIAFIGMSNEELMKQATMIMSKNPDLAVIVAEKAGVRPILPESLRKSEEVAVEETDETEHYEP